MVSGQLAVCVDTAADSGCTIGLRGRVMYEDTAADSGCTIGLRGRVMYEDTAGDLAYTQESTICSDSRYIKR